MADFSVHVNDLIIGAGKLHDDADALGNAATEGVEAATSAGGGCGGGALAGALSAFAAELQARSTAVDGAVDGAGTTMRSNVLTYATADGSAAEAIDLVDFG